MGRALLVDATSIYSFQQYLKKHEYPVQGNINYGALLRSLSLRMASGAGVGVGFGDRGGSGYGDGSGRGNRSCFDLLFAFVAINPEHEGQKKFCAYLRGQGFAVDETDFRDAFIVPNREFPYQRLSTRLAYMAGMLTAPYDKGGNQRELPHLVVVTDAFDLYAPLVDYTQTRGGQVTIAFFRRGMEDRWQRAGLFVEDSSIRFCDLSDDAKAIVGADLASGIGTKEGGRGLADFSL